ncbi:MAG: hypothetical protein QS748_14385 [Candidatus Endonucleobacter bathymodioli]|uniref:Uncharacterized protein n=1 Tax=Candidatus Endonucleibacter bathymodioli TaxID=539814 RepID=A0AA90NN89_9GAMM|nr:hypothetical protein [Candidatus Endonucleobacter bathymodioli]MDP0590304.1 hypothetical protein [Candidatus Endonucleobacter bathymodioli]
MNIYNSLESWKNELYHVYKHIYTVLYGMFFMLTLVFSNPAFSVIEGEFHDGGGKTGWKKRQIKELFFDNMMNLYSCWLDKNRVKGGIIGSAGIKIISGDSSLIGINDIDIVLCDKEKAEDLMKYLNSEIQKVIYAIADNNLRGLVNIAFRTVWTREGLSDKTLEKGQITMFDISSNDPLAAVDIVAKDFDGDDIMFTAWDYHFQTECNFGDKKNVEISVLTPLSYASLDDNSMKKDVEYFKKAKGNEGGMLGDTMDEVICSCQNLYKIRSRFAFYQKLKKEKSYDKILMEKIYEVYGSYGALLNEINEINEKSHIVNVTHKKAFDFDYALGDSLGDRPLLTQVEWEKVLGKDFDVCNVELGDDCFCCIISNAINGNCMVRERFLSTANSLLCEEVDGETEYVTPMLVRSVINKWVTEVICVLLNKKFDKDEVSRFLDLPYDSIDYLMSSEHDKSSNNVKDVISFFGESVPLLPLALSTGIPFVVFSPEKHESKVTVSLFNPEDSWNKWPDVMKILGESESLIATENTMVKDVMFISHSGEHKYYLCMKKFDTAKRIDPLLIVEEILLDKNIFQCRVCPDKLSEELVAGSNVMPIMGDSFPLDKKAIEANNHDIYVRLVKKCMGICFSESNGIVGNTHESQETSTEEDISSQPISIVNTEDSGELHINIDTICSQSLLDADADANAKEVASMTEELRNMTENILLGLVKMEDVCGMEARLRWKTIECKHKIQYAKNIEEINKVMTDVFDEVSEPCQQGQCVVDGRVVVNLNKCCSVIKLLMNADDLGCPLAPLILGVYQMIQSDSKYLDVNDIVGIIKCFIKSAERGNIQAPACLYWLAKITGSTEALSLSFSLSAIFNKIFSDKILALNFVFTGNDNLVKVCNKLWLPVALGRWSYQKKSSNASKLLAAAYHRYSELGEDYSGWQIDQHLSVVDRIAYASHLAFFYLHSGDKEMSMQEFRKAALAYVWLVQKTDDISVIPNITKAAGLASIYHIIPCDYVIRDRDYIEFNDMLFSLNECGSNSDFLWTLKSIGDNKKISAVADCISKISYFIHRKKEGVVFKNIDDMGNELTERSGFIDYQISSPGGCGNAKNMCKLDMSDISVTRRIAKNKITNIVGPVAKSKNGKRATKAVNNGNSGLLSGSVCIKGKERKRICASILNLSQRSAVVLDSFARDGFVMVLGHNVRVDIREKSMEMFKENVNQFKKIDMIMASCTGKVVVKLSTIIYDGLWAFLQVIANCDVGYDFDSSLAESIAELSLRLFGKGFENVRALISANELSIKFCCLTLLNPLSYQNIDENMQGKMITRLFVFLGDFVRDLGADMQAVDVKNRESVSKMLVLLLNSILDVVDDHKLHLLIIDIMCNAVVGAVDEDLLGSVLLRYFIGVENQVDCNQRENDYLMVQKYLGNAKNKGRLSGEFYTKWNLFVISPYKCLREADEKQKEEDANLIAAELIREEEKVKDEVERKQKLKKEAISRILKRSIIKNDEERLGESFECRDLSKSMQFLNLGVGGCEDENNKSLIFLYEKMLNMEFGTAFKGFCDCEEKEKIKSGSVGSVHLAIINILQFECLVERVKHECSTFLYLSKQSRIIKKYLYCFVVLEGSDKLPDSVSAEQLKDTYDAIKPLIDVLGEDDCMLNKAIEYAGKATSILNKFHKYGKEELGLLLLQEEQLREQIVQAGEVYQDMVSILNIRREILGRIREKGTARSAGKRIVIKANDLLKSCNQAIRDVDKLKYQLDKFDKLKQSGDKSN